ncbi:MAG: hypothetical protein IJD04_05820 [Desulfovibrionaceae bacterium]|nr:hypothetical protein [Desulfovibrionaceae bacterium]
MGYTFITSTAHSLLRPLAWQGIAAQSAYDQLAHTLRVNLGEQAASVLAEPIGGQDSVDWYANGAGVPVPLDALTAGEQEIVCAELASFCSRAGALAERLKQEPGSNAVTAGNLLELALSVPSSAYLYALKNSDGKLSPLLVGWGCTLTETEQGASAITRLLPAGAAAYAGSGAENLEEKVDINADLPPSSLSVSEVSADSQPENAEPQRADVANADNTGISGHEKTVRHVFPFPWALFAFLAAAAAMIFILFRLLPGLGGGIDLGLSGCAREQQTTVSPGQGVDEPGYLEELYRAQGREAALRDELAYLRNEYQLRLLLCGQPDEPEPAPKPAPEPLPEPEPEPAPPVPELALPELPPDPPPAPEKPKQPEPKAEPKPQPDTMVIPENPTDLSFLQGCWYAQTGLKSTRTNMPISVKYCFDAQGNGSITLTERDRKGRETQICRGGARARLNGERLFIHDLGARCPDGSKYERENITCRNADGSKALCTGVGEPSGRRNWFDKPFTRTDR